MSEEVGSAGKQLTDYAGTARRAELSEAAD
jgi:hypothetical protein